MAPLILSLFASVALAHSTALRADAAPLTWDEATAAALAHNPDLNAARLSAEAADANYYGSFNAFLPRLTLSNGYSDSRFSSGLSRFSSDARASLSVIDVAKAADISAAGASRRRARHALLDASAGLRFELRRAFARLLQSQDNLKTTADIATLRTRGAEMVRLRYDSGRESKGNMLRTEAERLSAEADARQARRDLRAAQATLARLTGSGGYAVLVASGALTAGGPPAEESDLTPLSLARPDVAVEAARLEISEADLRRAHASRYPTLSASYARSWAGRKEFPTGQPSWSFGTSLSWAFFGGGPTDAYFASAAARAGLDAAREALRSAKDRAVEELEGARASFAGAADQRQVADALLEASRQRNDEGDVRYASGLMNFENWQSIVTERAAAERRALASRFDAVAAEAAWDRAVGRPLGDR